MVAPKSRRGRHGIGLSPSQIERLAECCAPSANASEDDFLFWNDRGSGKGPLCTKRVMKKMIWPIAAKLGIRKIGWHMLRHWNITNLDEEGSSTKVCQERLGHAFATVNSQCYTHMRDSVSQEAADALNRRFEARKKLQPANVGTRGKSLLKLLKAVAGVEGLEPPTLGLEIRCSLRLSYTPESLFTSS